MKKLVLFSSQISQDGINKLDLEEFICTSSPKIKYIHHLENLKKLEIDNSVESDISNLKLIKLTIHDNVHIFDLGYMNTLKDLSIEGISKITQKN